MVGIMNFLKNSYSSMSPDKGELDASMEMTLNLNMWHTRSFYSLLYKLVEILDADEFLDFPPKMSRSILRVGMWRTRSAVGLL